MSRSVIVFGASGGLGSELIARLAQDGTYQVYGTAHSEIDGLSATLRGLGLDPDRHGFSLDATDFEAVRACVAQVGAQSELWGIVNLVGVPSAQRLGRATAGDIEHELRANLLPAFWTTKAMLESHRAQEQRGGRLLHASSVVVRRPIPGTAPYAAAKGAVEAFVRSIAEETARVEVTVNALRLGYFDIGMGGDVPDAFRNQVVADTPEGRLGTSADLAATVSFLLSDAADFVTGSTLDLDGGLA